MSAPAAAPRISAPAPAPRISAPAFSAPRISAPQISAPRFSAPAPRIAAPSPRFNAPSGPRFSSPRFNAPSAPSRVASPRFNSPKFNAQRFAEPRGPSRFSRGPSGVRGPGLATRNLSPPNGPRANREALTPLQGRRGNALTATPRNLPGATRSATPTTTPSTMVGQGPAARGRNLAAAAQALTRAPNGRLGLRNAAFASLSKRDPAARTLSQSAFSGRFAQNRAAWSNDWRFRRHRHALFVLGFVGPLFWPYAYDDFIDYTFWPAAYDTFWPYAFDDVYAGIYGGYAPDIYPAYATGGAGDEPAYGGRTRRGRTRMASAPAGGGAAAPICSGQAQGLTDLPIERIAQQVQPDQSQQALLEELKAATQQALQIMQDACPTELPSTPLGRMNAMRARVDAMLRAVQTVRPALDKFYASLSDEQKERFNALDVGNTQTARRADLSQVCSGRAARTEVPTARIERTLRLTGPQEAALRALDDASAKAADILAQNCPTDQPLTPPGRLAAMEQRLTAMLQAIDTVRPALAKFYDSLNDEQKARLNRLGPRTA